MDVLQRLLLPCEENTLYDRNHIAITTTTVDGSKRSYLLDVQKESQFLKNYVLALSNIVLHYEVVLDSMMEHCLFFDYLFFPGKSTILQDAQNLYLAATKEIRQNMEWFTTEGTDKFLDCAFLLSRHDGFHLIFPLVQISRLDYDILVSRLSRVFEKGEGGRLDTAVQGLTLFGSTRNYKQSYTIDGFFRHGEPSLHTEVNEQRTLRNEFVEVTTTKLKQKATNYVKIKETYVNLFYPRESKFRSKRMCHVRYPLIVVRNLRLQQIGDDSLPSSGGCGGRKLVFRYSERNAPPTLLYSVSKSTLNDDRQYEKFEHPFVLQWAKVNQNVFSFEQVCRQVWTCFSKFYPVTEDLRPVDQKTTSQNAEKQRRYIKRLKSDPRKKEEYLQKERERWKKRKESGKIKSVKELTTQQRLLQQKKWRESQQNYRRKTRKQIFYV